MRVRVLAALFIAALLLGFGQSLASYASPITVAVARAHPPLFDTEAAAQKHCPTDEVVWLKLPTGIYHEKGMRWYGRTKSGAFVCRKEADAAGDRDTRNGQ